MLINSTPFRLMFAKFLHALKICKRILIATIMEIAMINLLSALNCRATIIITCRYLFTLSNKILGIVYFLLDIWISSLVFKVRH